jgi:predicted nucleic acid-binding protein
VLKYDGCKLGRRPVSPADLLIAAAAEAAGVAVLHYDADYDRIAEVTGQPTQWLAPKGSLR